MLFRIIESRCRSFACYTFYLWFFESELVKIVTCYEADEMIIKCRAHDIFYINSRDFDLLNIPDRRIPLKNLRLSRISLMDSTLLAILMVQILRKEEGVVPSFIMK